MFLQYVDTAMVGRLGETATASVSITMTVSWLINSVNSAAGIAVLALISRAVGSKDRERVGIIAKQALFLAVASGCVTGSISLLLSPWIPVWMGAERAIQKEASRYFFIVCLPMVFRTMNTVLGAAIRATKDTRTPMLINMAANGVNVLLNGLFIYTMGLGVAGAAIASAVSYTVSGTLMLCAYRKNSCLHWNWHEFAVDLPVLWECKRIGLPVLGTSVASCLGYVVFASLVSDMGTTVFAAHSIAVTAETCFYIPGYGLRTATSAIVGTDLGEGDFVRLEKTALLSVTVTVGFMCLSGIFLYHVSNPLMRVFTSSAHVAGLGARMLRLVAFSEPFFGLMVVLEGIYYGLGRTRYSFVVETGSMWGIRILFTWLCVRRWQMELYAVWWCMIADNVCKAVLLALPAVRRKWRERMFSVPQKAEAGM
ncbi:MAG: MATE family efflux transporter [Lachnospiraceae bacterium]|nr:MATE family efflux transporter [Lachnospiraceae bacterium]